MSRVPPLLSARSNRRLHTLLLAAALVIGTGACAGSEADDTLRGDLFLAPVETLVWNNLMPGTRPRCNAQLRLLIANRGSEAIVLRAPEAMITTAQDAQPMRRFIPLMTVNDRLVRELSLAPGDSVEAHFRSPDFGLEPIDVERYPRARFLLRMESSDNEPLEFRSPVTEVFVTQ